MIMEIDFDKLDQERKAFFFIIKNNYELLENINKIYDFETNSLKIYENKKNKSGLFIEEKEFQYFSSTAKKLLNIALSLYNGKECDFFNSFAYFNKKEYLIVLQALEYRFNFENRE